MLVGCLSKRPSPFLMRCISFVQIKHLLTFCLQFKYDWHQWAFILFGFHTWQMSKMGICVAVHRRWCINSLVQNHIKLRIFFLLVYLYLFCEKLARQISNHFVFHLQMLTQIIAWKCLWNAIHGLNHSYFSASQSSSHVFLCRFVSHFQWLNERNKRKNGLRAIDSTYLVQ